MKHQFELYQEEDLFKFDDEDKNIKGFPLKYHVSEVIERVAKMRGINKDKIILVVSTASFSTKEAILIKKEYNRSTKYVQYFNERYRLSGWIDETLFSYFPIPPQRLYVDIKEKKS